MPLFSQFPSGFSADDLRKSLAANRAQFYRDFASTVFYGFNRPGAKPLDGVIGNWWRQGMIGGAKAHYDGIKAFSETDLTEDLKSIDVPTLVMQGEDDQVVPYKGAALLQVKLLKNSTLKLYPGSRMACSPLTPRRSIRISWNSLRDEVRTRADCARIDHVVSQRERIA